MLQTKLNTVSIKPLEVYDDLCLVAQSYRFGNGLRNAKMKPWQASGDFIQFTVLPLKYVLLGEFKGQGIMREAQALACSPSCRYRLIHEGGCYVNNEVRTAVLTAHKHLINDTAPLDHFNTVMRFTVWGDVGRLNDKGIMHVRRLINHATSHLAYTADFGTNWMQPLKGNMLASVQTKAQLIDAVMLGWKCYISGEEAFKTARKLGLSLYGCPQNNKGTASPFGCSTCPIACNGKRNVVAHELWERRNEL